MQQPKGFVRSGSENLVCKLERSIYGLKQSAKVWNETIGSVLAAIGFKQSRADPCLWMKYQPGGVIVYLIIYVDDMIVACTAGEEIEKLERELQEKIQLSSLGEINLFLGIRVIRDNDGFYSMDQEIFIRKIASRYGLEKAKGSNYPVDTSYYRNREGSRPLPNNHKYHSLVGSLLYVAVNTRPDVAASVSILSRRVKEPTEVDWTELKRILRYLMKTADYKLKLMAHREEVACLVGFSDADWSNDPSDRKSNTGYLFQFGGATICWVSRKQSSVSLSSMEAEYIALSDACKELAWLRRLLEDIGEKQNEPTVVFEDNMGCINFVEVEKQSKRSKHIDTRMCFTKELLEKGEVTLRYCPSESMTADILTKPVGTVKQLRYCEMMGLIK